MTWRSRVLACALAVLATACGGGGAPTRGFGSRQLLPTRDPTLELDGQLDDHTLLASTGDSTADTSYLSIDVVTGQVQALGSTFPDSHFTGDGPQLFTCMEDGGVPTTLTITDTKSGQTTSIDGLTGSLPDCPSDASQIIFAWRVDDAGLLALWAGPYDRLARIKTDLLIHQHVDSAANPSSLIVLAAPSADPGALGLFSIDKATFVTTVVIPAAIGPAALAEGAAAGVTLASSSLSSAYPAFSLVDRFVYGRAMSDGQVVVFVGAIAAGPARELALFPAEGPASFIGVARTQLIGTRPGFAERDGSRLRYWDDGLQRLVTCDLPAGTAPLVGTSTLDGTRLLFYEQQFGGTGPDLGPHGPLLLVSLDLAAQGAACSLLASQDVVEAGFSRDDSAMFWVTAPAQGDATLWAADGDGSGARQVGAAASVGNAHFLDGTRLELSLGTDLVWLDVRDPTTTLHYIVEKVFGGVFDFLGATLITGYEYNEQDGTGMLGLVDRETGVKRPISPAVVWYRLAALAPAADSDVPTTGVSYLVRGRNPSSQDGLWFATLAPADLR